MHINGDCGAMRGLCRSSLCLGPCLAHTCTSLANYTRHGFTVFPRRPQEVASTESPKLDVNHNSRKESVGNFECILRRHPAFVQHCWGMQHARYIYDWLMSWESPKPKSNPTLPVFLNTTTCTRYCDPMHLHTKLTVMLLCGNHSHNDNIVILIKRTETNITITGVMC